MMKEDKKNIPYLDLSTLEKQLKKSRGKTIQKQREKGNKSRMHFLTLFL